MDSGLHFSLPCLPEPISQRACQFSTLHYLRVVLNRIRAQRPKVTQAALSSCKVYIIFSNPEIVAKLVLGLSLSCTGHRLRGCGEREVSEWAGLKASYRFGRLLQALV